MAIYQIQPQDVLFFRDARPMESQSPSGGHGARWPHPGVFFDAIHVALWRAFAEPAGHGFAQHSFYGKRNGQRQRLRNGGTFFQTLATAGPFPVREAQWLFSAPADAQPGGGALHPITQDQAESDLPKPLRHPLGSNSTPSKVPVPPWWSREAMHAHLTGSGATQTAWSADDLFAEEWSTGIGSDPATGTQDGQRIYSAQYLRLRDTVRLGLSATLPEAAHGEGLDQLFRIGTPTTIVVGGQQRACHVERIPESDLTRFLPVSPPLPPGCTRVKWVLLSPAVYPAIPSRGHPGGWLPTWVNHETGQVLLSEIQTATAGGHRPRHERRHPAGNDRLQQCSLVAACIPKPLVLTGWTDAMHVPPADDDTPIRRPGPRPTLLAVPAGAVYYFDCTTPDAAQALCRALAWHGPRTAGVEKVIHRRSSLLGEKGFGLGVCGWWEPFPTSLPSPPTPLRTPDTP